MKVLKSHVIHRVRSLRFCHLSCHSSTALLGQDNSLELIRECVNGWDCLQKCALSMERFGRFMAILVPFISGWITIIHQAENSWIAEIRPEMGTLLTKYTKNVGLGDQFFWWMGPDVCHLSTQGHGDMTQCMTQCQTLGLQVAVTTSSSSQPW